tara:strand:+ start:51 stop:236 length:186 start_codon:yes stop_codon:yes gene_type:complete
MMINLDNLYSIKEYANKNKVSRTYVDNWCKEKDQKGYSTNAVTGKKFKLINKNGLKAILEG